MASSSQMKSHSPESTLARRKSTATKRRVIQSDEDEWGDEDAGDMGMEAQRPATKRVRRGRSTPVDDMDVDVDVDDTNTYANMNVDIDGEDEYDQHGPAKAGSSSKVASKRRRSTAAFSSDGDGTADDHTSDDDGDFRDAPPSPGGHQLSDGDYDHELPPARSKPVRAKTATWKVRNGEDASATRKAPRKSATAAAKPGKGKAAKKEKEREIKITAKDERKPTDDAAPPPKLSRSHSNSNPKRAKSQVQDDDPFPSAPSDSAPAPISAVPAPDPKPTDEPSLPPKKRLPTIRKNKPATSGPSTPSHTSAPPLTTTAKPPASAAAAATASAISDKLLGAGGGASATTARKQGGTADFDLRDQKAWAAIFKQSGSSTPRSGLSRREKEEERRRELYKMRDEARVRREEALRETFDLQAQWDKISTFEETLRAQRSSVLFPNIFAAKFRDEYEREKRQRGDRDAARDTARDKDKGLPQAHEEEKVRGERW